ncbi:MAG: adaptor protein MecA [Anaerotignaceae bacterium]
MKIEKISENQIKLTLTSSDLKERNINLEELIKPSAQTQELFRDIMEQAFSECGFSFENTPLMVEATPISLDGLMIIVTKLPEKETQKDTVSLMSQNKDLRRYKKKTISHYKPEQISDEGICVFSFETLDTACEAALRLDGVFSGFSQLYKYQDRYYMLLQNNMHDTKNSLDTIDLLLFEYGQKHISTPLSKYHLMEHGELMVKNPAIATLSTIF